MIKFKFKTDNEVFHLMLDYQLCVSLSSIVNVKLENLEDFFIEVMCSKLLFQK